MTNPSGRSGSGIILGMLKSPKLHPRKRKNVSGHVSSLDTFACEHARNAVSMCFAM
ncbi:MAG: hypothetical protein LBD33_00600 [Puniceicoccales bacterium]|nr:hypothetical protein [Puniceicoccales bacterium]